MIQPKRHNEMYPWFAEMLNNNMYMKTRLMSHFAQCNLSHLLLDPARLVEAFFHKSRAEIARAAERHYITV